MHAGGSGGGGRRRWEALCKRWGPQVPLNQLSYALFRHIFFTQLEHSTEHVTGQAGKEAGKGEAAGERRQACGGGGNLGSGLWAAGQIACQASTIRCRNALRSSEQQETSDARCLATNTNLLDRSQAAPNRPRISFKTEDMYSE